jgi:hypothetical protein
MQNLVTKERMRSKPLTPLRRINFNVGNIGHLPTKVKNETVFRLSQ